MAAGYSGTPLAKKLGIKPGSGLFLAGAPDHYDELLAPLPEGVERVRKIEAADVMHIFVTARARLDKELRAALPKMKQDVAIWVSWPKKAARIEGDLTFEAVQEIGLATGLVDNKSASIDDRWQALRFVYRLADR